MGMDISASKEEFEDALAQKSHRDVNLTRTLVFIICTICCSWVMGASGVSLAWLLLIIVLVVIVWHSKLTRLVAAVVNYETLKAYQRKAMYQDESAEWLNFLINRWWVFSSPTIFTLVKDQLEPLLNEAKPGIIDSLEVKQFTLGNQTPYVRSVKAFDMSSGKTVPLSTFNLGCPPSTLALSLHHQVALKADFHLDCDDFTMVLRTRLFSKEVGMDLDLAVEKLNISGNIFITLVMNMDIPFPHISNFTFTFLEKPDIWFSIRILKAVQMMEVPLLKSWIHSLVIDALAVALVDPGKLDISVFSHSGVIPLKEAPHALAQGVLTVNLSIPSGAKDKITEYGDLPWLVLILGDQRRVTSRITLRWQEKSSFLVSSLRTDSLTVKIKSKKFVSAMTVAGFDLPLASYNLDSARMVETVLQKKVHRSCPTFIPNVSVRLQYMPLPTVNINKDEIYAAESEANERTFCGVLLVHVHGADNLCANESECNPYCMVFSNRRKMKTTHYARKTTNPRWESVTEFLVSDYSQTTLSFVICSCVHDRTADSDLIGIAMLNMNEDETCIRKRRLPVNSNNMSSTMNGNHASASITISVIFRSVPSVFDTELPSHATLTPTGEEMNGKLFFKHHVGSGYNSSTNQSLMEVVIFRARDLISKDLNGFSDPYCEIKINNECKYKTCVKKKTLNPVWEESAVMGLPGEDEALDVIIWDRDVFGMKDFLGNVTLHLADIRQFSMLDMPHWFQLSGVKSGAVQLKFKIIPDDKMEAPGTGVVNPARRVFTVDNSHNELNAMEIPQHIPKKETDKHNLSFEKNVDIDSNFSSSGPSLLVPIPVLDGSRVNASGHLNPGGIGHSTANSATGSTLSPAPDVNIVNLQDPNSATGSSPTCSNHESLSSSSDKQEYSPTKTISTGYSSFAIMKQKVKRGLSHPLRRFKSEMSVNEDKSCKKSSTVTLSIEPRGGGEADATELLHEEGLSHAISQPNILSINNSPRHPKRPTDLKVPVSVRPEKYRGIEGKAIQARGLTLQKTSQIYLHIKLQSPIAPEKVRRSSTNIAGKTLVKSHLIPAAPNPRFDLNFQVDDSEGVAPQSFLVFDIRTSNRQVVATRKITLYDLFTDTNSDNTEVCTWLSLSSGVSLEVKVGYGKQVKKSSRKLFRSWSVHRIGKV